MKKRYLIVMTLCSSLWLNAQNFIHPGMLHTQADLDRTKAKVEAGEEPWASAYRKLLTSPHVSLDWKAAPVEKIVRGGRTIWEPDPDNYQLAYRDAATAYQCALVWHISGDKAYADKSVQILNAWAKTCKKVSGRHECLSGIRAVWLPVCQCSRTDARLSGMGCHGLRTIQRMDAESVVPRGNRFPARTQRDG